MFRGCMNPNVKAPSSSMLSNIPPKIRYPLQGLIIILVLWFLFAPDEVKPSLAVWAAKGHSSAYDGVFSDNPKTYNKPATTQFLLSYLQQKEQLPTITENQYQIEYHDLDKDVKTQEVFIWLTQDGLCNASDNEADKACRMYLFQLPKVTGAQDRVVNQWAKLEQVKRPIILQAEGKGLPRLEVVKGDDSHQVLVFNGGSY